MGFAGSDSGKFLIEICAAIDVSEEKGYCADWSHLV